MSNRIKIANLKADPPNAIPSKKQNCGLVLFDCDVPCVLCFGDTSVFGESSLSLKKDKNYIEMTGIEGDSSTYRICADAANCPALADLAEQFDITIGS